MTPVRSKNNLLALPCPKCQKPNPVESRMCACGHPLVQQNEVPTAAAAFPELRSILPEIKKKQANLRLVVPKESKIEAVSPDRLKLVEVNSEPISAPTFQLPIGENKSKRGLYALVFTALLLSTAAGAYFGGFLSFPERQSQAAQPVQFVQSAVAEVTGTDSRGEVSPTANEGQSDQPPSAVDETRADGPALKIPSAKPTVTRAAVNESKTDSESKNDQTVAVVRTDESAPSESSENRPANSAIAVARCGDGTYSYRKSASGTCAYRGGVVQWLDGTKPSSSPSRAPKIETDRAYVLGSRGGCYYLTASGAKKYVDKSYCN